MIVEKILRARRLLDATPPHNRKRRQRIRRIIRELLTRFDALEF